MKINESKIVVLIYAITCVLLCMYAFNLPNNSLELGDSINHYLFAKYAFIHPENFLDLWAKPMFVILSSLFAAMGMQAVYIFNICCALITSFILYKCARILNIEEGWCIVLLSVLTPVYFALLPTALTEVLCSLFLAVILWTLLNKKYFLAALVASFLPFARQEGYLILPIMMVVLVLIKQYKFIPLLFIGILLYCVSTYFTFNDALWIIHHHPYNPGKSIYGNGSLLHYINQRDNIFGKYYFIFLVLSIGILVFTRIINIIQNKNDFGINIVVLFLLVGFPIAFFSIHTYIWWKGVSGSAGLIRVMGVIIPYCSLIVAYGLSLIKTKVFFRSFLYYGFLIVFFYKMCMGTLQPLYRNLSNTETRLIDEGIDKMKKDMIPLTGTIFCFDPYVSYALNKDAFNPNEIRQGWDLNLEQPHLTMKKKDLMIWDSHFYIPSITPIKDSLLFNDLLSVVFHKTAVDAYDSSIQHEVFIVQRK